MKGDEFVAEVKNLAELGSNEEAQEATRATLETLKGRLAGKEPRPTWPHSSRPR